MACQRQLHDFMGLITKYMSESAEVLCVMNWETPEEQCPVACKLLGENAAILRLQGLYGLNGVVEIDSECIDTADDPLN
ncbi:hypothetical protein GX50_01582 [[Emmonsia] crescens]|uniref:Uncharacterized protein n=1 Tax=[Emmonsia] crescens TaxID=73230 RepID=A0A2B7ZQE9_9EURO|nr:hypothetical protein GX50_01582 [Emmonsia crescens]